MSNLRRCASLLILLLGFVLSSAARASCEYVLTQYNGPYSWSAEITVTNTGSSDVVGWDVSWSYPDTSTPYHPSGYSFSNASSVYTATAPSYNGGIYTLSPGEVAVVSFSGGGNGSGLADSVTGDICGPAVISQDLTIVKEVINDDGRSAAIGEFGLSTDAGTLVFDGGSTSGNTTTYTSDKITVAEGTFTLSESDHADYTEGAWSCTGAAGAVVDTYNAGSVEIAVGESVTCTIINNDIGEVYNPPTEYSLGVCSVDPATAFWQRGVEWNSNNGGDPTLATAIDTDVFASAESFKAGPGVTITASNTAILISGADQADYTSAYEAGDFLEYTVVTSPTLSDTTVISGFSENGGRDNTAPYQMDMILSDDDFATGVRIFSNYVVNDDIPADATSQFSWITENMEQVYLESGTEYKFRLVFYAANPSTTNIMMDDFAISADNCTDRGDAPYAVDDENQGGHYLPEIREHYIGTIAPDAEFYVPGDDNTDGETRANEESGIVIPTSLNQGQAISIDVPVTGSGGLLNAWIDWDGNEVFDADEKVATDTTLSGGGASGTITLNLTVPTDAVIGTTYARFRWSPNSVTNATDFVPKGEMEDYEVTIADALASATLTLQKTVVNDGAGTAVATDWTLNASDGTTTITGIQGDTAITAAVVAAGTYSLSESGGPVGYTQTSLTCSGAADTDASDGLALAAGEDVTCTFVNDDAAMPELTVSKSLGATGALQADGTFTQAFTISLESTGDAAVSAPSLVDNLEILFGDMYTPSAAAVTTSGVSVAPVVTADAANTGVAPAANASFDGDATPNLLDGTGSLDAGDSLTVTFTVILDAAETPASGTVVNAITATGTPPTGSTLAVVGTDEDGSATTDGSAAVTVTSPTGTGAIGVVKTAVVDLTTAGGTATLDAGDTINYTYVVTNTSTTLNAYNVTVSETASFTGTGTAPTPAYASGGSNLDSGALTDDLAPSGTLTWTASYVLTQDDIEAGKVDNQAKADATDSFNNPLTDLSDDTDSALGNDNATSTPLTQVSSLSIVKADPSLKIDADTSTNISLGDTLEYVVTVTNDGNIAQNNVIVSDAQLTPSSMTCVTLAPGATCVLTGTHEVTLAEADAGEVVNTAAVVSDELPTSETSNEVTTQVETDAELTVLKSAATLKTDADTSGDITLGDTLEYTVTVTNEGTATQNNVVVSDPQLTPNSFTCVTLAPAATCVLTGTHEVTLAEADAGQVLNTAGAVSDEVSVSVASNTVTTTVETAPSLDIVKAAATLATDADSSGDVTLGDTLSYTITVTNDGNATQNNVIVTDAQLIPGSMTCATLAPDATCELTGTHEVTLAEADAGEVVNTAAVVSDELPTSEASNEVTTQVETEAELTVLKSAAALKTDADTSGDITLGDTLEYTVTVTNAGTATQNNVVVSDVQLTPNSFTCVTLAPAATCVLTGTHEVTLAEADAGQVVNIAGAVSDEVSVSVASNTVTTTVETDPSLDIVKAAATLATDADSSGDVTLGDTLSYTITVTNDGSATQNNVIVSDVQLTPSSMTCATLAPGATCVLTGTHEVMLAEADAGEVVNTASVVSDELPTREASNEVTTTVETDAELTILKSAATLKTDADTSGDITLGDILEYTVTVTNEGTATQNNVVVSDPQLTPNSFTCATLAPAATCVLTGTHEVTLAEADAGQVVNTAGAVSDEVSVSVASNTVTTTVETDPSLDIVKAAATLATDADSSGDVTLGDTLSYTITVTNGGNATQNNVIVSDVQLTPSSMTCATLAPGATCVLTGTHEVTLAEADAGEVVNTAAVVSDQLPTSKASNEVTTTVETDAELTILKSAATLKTDADTSGDITLGDILEYTVTVTNEGTATQNNVVVSDPQLTPNSFTCATLAPAATCVLTGTHEVTLAEADAGQVVNTAGAVSDEVSVSVASNTITTIVETDPSLDIVKAAATLATDADSSGDVTLGDTLSYTITVTNDGNVTQNNVIVSDAQLTPSSMTCVTLAPSGTCVLTGTHEVTLAEADAGEVVNTAAVVSDELPTSEASNEVTTLVATDAELTVLKSAATLKTDADTSGDITLGDTLEYTVTVTNAGTATQNNVVVSDSQLTPNSFTCATLAPAATCVLTGTHEVTLAEADAGQVVNTAGAVSDEASVSVASNTITTIVETDPSLDIVKAAATLATDADSSGNVTLGDTLSYTITVTNDGNVTQNNVIVTDAQLTPSSMTCMTLAPSATCVLTGTHEVTLAEADAGEVVNTAAVVSDELPTSEASNKVTTLVATDAELTVLKSAATLKTDADTSGDITLGDTLEYTVTVTNEGTATQNNVVVSDAQLIPSSFTCATLAPAATCVLTGTHEVRLAEADAGQVVNTAGAVSDEVSVSVASNTIITTVETDPSLDIVKAAATLATDADSSGDVTLGDTLSYTITVTNDGNVTQNNIVVVDTQLTPNTTTCVTLAPGATCVLTGTHEVTLAEADAGVVVNTADVLSDELPTSEASNTVNTPVTTTPSLDLVKAAATILTDADNSMDVTLGDTLEYVITATNDGNETLTNVVVSDAQLTPNSTTCATLAPMDTCVLTGTHEVTLVEADAGQVVNTAGVVSDETPTSVTSNTVTTPVNSEPLLTILKSAATLATDADASGDITLGDTLEYTITATNKGNTTVGNVVVSDVQLTPSTITCATLAPNATCVLTGTHEVTLAEVDAGQVVNTAEVTSDVPPTQETSNTVNTPIETDPSLDIVKAAATLATDADSSGDVTLGDTLSYTITVTNDGNATQNNVIVSDAQLTPSSLTCLTLAPGATCVLTGTHEVTLTEADAGTVENTAGVISDEVPTSVPSNTVKTPILADPSLEIIKSPATIETDADSSMDVTLGDTLQYVITVTNSGNATQTNVVVSDAQLTPSSFTCATLAPSATCVLTGNHEVTLAESDAGEVVNTAEVVSDEVPVSVTSNTITTPVEDDPLLEIVKSAATLLTDADSSGDVTLGDTLEYTITATNSGNSTITDVDVTDVQLMPSAINCPTLAPGAACVLTGTHVVTLAEVDAGVVVNTANVVSDVPPTNETSNTVSTPVLSDPSLDILKAAATLTTDADSSGDITLGDTISYTVTVTNDGNSTQNNVVVSDTQLTPSSFVCTTLAPNETCVLTGTHEITLAEVDAGQVVNTAAVVSDELPTSESSNTVTTPVLADPSLALVKADATLMADADSSMDITLGDTIEYVITATNDGNETLTNVVISDAQLTPSSMTCATLAPSSTCVLTGTHEVTLAEADAGQVVNTASVVSDETPTSVPSNTVTTPIEEDQLLAIIKATPTLVTDADSSGDITLGDTLEYTITVTNTGNSTVSDVVVTDTQLTPSTISCATLAPAATCVLTGTHEVTLAEVDAGQVENTASVVSDIPPMSETSNTVTTPISTNPSLAIVKAAATLETDADSSGDVTLGDTLTYTVTVTNSGNSTQNNVVVSDTQLTPSSFSCATLAPNATCVLTGTHEVTLAEADAGEVLNTANVVSDEVTTSAPSNTVTTPVETDPLLTLVKAGAILATDADSSTSVTLGDTLEYVVTATNNGNETLTNVIVSDAQLTPSSMTCATLAPAATCVLTGTHVVTLAEADAGEVLNTAGVISDEITDSVPSNTVKTPVLADSDLAVVKAEPLLLTDADTSGNVTLGDTLEYTVTVANTGNTTQNNVVISDAQLTPSSLTCVTLAPGATCELIGTHTVTLAEADAAQVVNTAGAVSDEVTTSVPSNTVTTLVETDLALTVVKSDATLATDADSSGDVTFGDTLSYVVTATNIGNSTQTNVLVTDPQLTPSSFTCATLAPASTCVLTGTHDVTITEANAGEVLNTASVVSNEVTTSVASNTVTTLVQADPTLTLIKSDATLATDADSSGDVTLGDTLEYVITATNTGNVALSNVIVSDAKLMPSSMVCATLAPTATCELTGTHVVTLAEADAGEVVNTAGVVSDETPTSVPSNTITTPIETDSSLSLVKAAATLATDADSSGDVTLGDTLEYVITATNTGNSTQKNVVVSDAQLTPSSMTCTTLAPNATCVLTGTHEVTLAEADASEVVNTAGVISDEVTTSVPSNTVVTPIGEDPALTLVKSDATLLTDADGSGDITFGDTLEYVITATNNGNVTLNNMVVSDAQLTPNNMTCATVAPNATCVLTGTHEVTLAEADAGEVVNTAGVVSDETPTPMPSNTVTTPIETNPSLSIVKAAAALATDADGSSDVSLGDTLSYTVTVTNDGNTTQNNVVVSDVQLTPSNFTCSVLAPSETCVLTGTHEVTLAEADAGEVLNTASVTSDETPTSVPSNTITTPVEVTPSLAIVKSNATLATDADSSTDITFGDTIGYVVTVTNDGNTTQNNVVVSDVQLTPSSITCSVLAPNETCVLTGTHEVTLAEADAGEVLNTAGVVSDETPTSVPSNTVTTVVETTASLSIVKSAAMLATDADSSTDVTAGDTLEYVVTVTNDGNTTQNNVVVSDTQLTPSSITCSVLAPNETCVLKGAHEVTLAEADAGEVLNTAGVVSDETPTSVPSNTVATPVETDPALVLVKSVATLADDADGSGDVTYADTLEYVITATNTGNATQTNVVISDVQLTPNSETCATVAPGATCVLTGMHEVTMVEATAGEVVNTAGVVSDQVPASVPSNTVTMPVEVDVLLEVAKGAAILATDTDGSGDVTLGDTLEYVVTATNTGNITQNNVVVSDDKLTPSSIVCATLAPNASCELTGTHVVTLAEADAGEVVNIAGVVSTETPTSIPSNTVTTPVETDPVLSIVKAEATLVTDADSSGDVTLGDTLEYVITATNTGNATQNNVVVSDAQLMPSSMTCVMLVPGSTCVLTGTHEVSLAESDAGTVENTAGVISDEVPTSIPSNTVITAVETDPSLTLVKAAATLATDADSSGDVTLGDTLEYVITATNTGNATQSNVVISDVQLTPNSFTCATLAPNATCELTGIHTVTLAEATAGEVLNTANVSSDEVTVSVPSNTVTTPVEADPSLTLIKSDPALVADADSSGDVTLGDTLEYLITATNTGNVALNNVIVSDAKLMPSSMVCATLAPNATCELAGTHVVTLAEADAGEVVNTAGVVSDETPTSVSSNTVTTPVETDAALSLVKAAATLATDADSSGDVTLGDTLEYVVTATNTGNTTQNNVVVSDAQLTPSSMTCTTLAPNATCVLTGTHEVTLAEADAGEVVNTAGAISDEVSTSIPSNTVVTPIGEDPALTLVKADATLLTDADGSGDITFGDTLEYVITATNNGNVTLNNMVVSDAQLTPNNMTCATVAPTASCVLTGTHEVSLAEADAGEVVNTAGVVSDETPTSMPSNTVITPIETNPSLSIVKAAATLATDADGSSDVSLGDTLAYTVTVTNDGNTTQNNVVVSDAQLTPSSFTCSALAPSKTCVLTGTHEVTLAEADAGEVVNTASVISDETPTSVPSNTVTTPVETDAALSLVKAAATLATDADSSGDVTLGDILEYVITATNTGNTTQTNVVVSDAQLTPSSMTCATLEPNATCVLTGTHEITLAEADAGEVVNTAGVISDEVSTSVPSNTVVTPTGEDPALTLFKADATLLTDADGSGDITFGDTLEYVITATNNGNVTLNNMVVSDAQLTPNNMTCAIVAPGSSCALTGTHEVTLAEADAGEVVNTAGVVSDETPTSMPSNTVTTPIETTPSLNIVKAAATLATDADGSSDVSLGDTLSYTVTVTNDGNTTQNNVVVSDAQLTPSSFTCSVLAPSETCVLTGTHEITLAEADAGEVVNTAGVVSDETPTSVPSNTVTTPVETDAALSLVKAAATLATDADSSGDVTLGDTLEYVVTATNTGNATQTNVVVSDVQLTPSSMTCVTLAPNATCVLTGTHEVTLAEADAGEVVNTAGVVSDEVSTSVPSNTVVTPIGEDPALTLFKADATLLTDADNSGDVTLGDTLEYVITATNNGNVTLNNMVVSDAQLTPNNMTCTTVAPSASCVLKGTHEVTLAEADAGEVVNTAAVVSDETPTSVPSNTVTTPVETDPALSLVKAAATLATDADSSGDVTLGDTLEYVITATNTGNATQTNVVVSDAQLIPSSMTCATLAPNATCVLTGTHEITLAEADTGEVVNTAGVVSDETPTSVPSNTVTTPIETDPALSLVKTAATLATDADSSGDVTLGDTLEYVITATNTGNATQTNVVVSDVQLTPSSITCATLAPNATCVLTGTHEVTLAEADAGQVLNTAGVISDEVSTSVPSNTVVTPVAEDPALTLVKTEATLLTDADNSGDVTLGDTLEYVITATNNGNVTLNNMVVSDEQLTPNNMTCATVAPGASCILKGTHEVTLAEANAGEVVNTAAVVSDETPTSLASNTVTTPVTILVKPDDETGTAVAGTTSTPVTDVTDGDTINGQAVQLGDSGNANISESGIWPTGFTLDPATGAISTDATVQPGIYTMQYELCDLSDPANCELATVEITVSGSITPKDDAGTAVAGTPSTPVANVTDSDMVNGQAAQLGDGGNATISESGTWPTGFTLDPATGAISTDATVQPGTYTMQYKLCDLSTPTNCELATVVITVAAEIIPDDEAGTGEAGKPSTPVADVTDGDMVNGQPAQLGEGGNATISESGEWPTGIMLDPETGAVNIDATAVAGTYTMQYELCDLSDPANCELATITIVVEANLPPVAEDDSSAPNQALGQPVTVETLGNDSDPEDKLDPTSVKIIDALGNPVTTLLVDGEGTWTVDLTTGAITFTPEDGFLADPTPVTYTVSDLSGNESNAATVTIDYEEPASITGVVWIDANQDGIVDTDEERKSGWTLQVKDDDGNIVGTAVTDAEGNYSITGLIPAEYTVEFYDAEGTIQASQRTEGSLISGQTIVLPLALEPVIVATPDLDDNTILLSKSVNKQEITVGDQLYYTVRAENLTEDEVIVDISDNLPAGFSIVTGKVKVTHAGTDGVFGTDDDTYPTSNTTGVDPVRFGPITLGAAEKAQVGYLVKVGTGASQGSSVNTAQAFGTGSTTDIASNIATATVEMVADTVIDQSTLVGKVFHDRDGDGYQDPANVTDLKVKSDYFGWNSLNLGHMKSRLSVLDNPTKYRKVVRMPWSSKNDFRVTTYQGTVIDVDHNGRVTESHEGAKARGWTAQDLRITTRRTKGIPTQTPVVAMRKPAVEMDVLEIVITNYGIHEEGIPGVRLATVKGLVLETDGYGRYNIPDIDSGLRRMGQNFIIKVDLATLPHGARMTTENPRVLRLTGTALEKINFGVKLYEQKREDKTVKVELNSAFFKASGHHIKASYYDVMDNIADKIKQYGQGYITVTVETQQGMTALDSQVMAKRRVHSVKTYLLNRLGHQMMANVKVEVSTQ